MIRLVEDPSGIKLSGRKRKMSLYFLISCVFKGNGGKEIMRALLCALMPKISGMKQYI